MLGQGPLFYLATLTLTQLPLNQSLALVIYWSLCYEVAFYAIVAAMMALTRRGSDAVPLLYGLHVLTITCLAWRLAGPRCPFPLDLWPQFGLGILAYHVASATDKRGAAAVLALASAMAIAFALIRGEGGDFAHPSPRISFLFSVVYTFALVGLRGFDAAISGRRIVRWLGWVGTFSYSLYLTHVVVLTPVSKLTRRLLGPTPELWLIVPIQVALAVVFARVFFTWFERPFIRARSARPSPAVEATGAVAVTATAP